ncbi:MAG TPA: hypothetical protein VHD60_00675 [Candidatus Saccharimonadales bacterium]|nr:hypothetical protein [Candidatus Saccharimonadales bacterium]
MSKSRNMGRRAHQAQDAELEMEEPSVTGSDMETTQPTRATQHPSKSTKSSGVQPLRRHSRRGE